MVDPKTELPITLTAEEWDRVLDVLGDGRFKVVNTLIRKILDQAQKPEAERPRLQPVN